MSEQSTVKPDIIERRKLRRERKAARREAALQRMTPEQAVQRAQAIAVRKELELQKGEKTTRKERGAMLRSMSEAVNNACHVGLRIKSHQEVPAAMLEKAKAVEQALTDELVKAVSHNAAGALQIAQMVSMQAVQAVQQEITRMETENQAAAIAPVATDTSIASPPIGEIGETVGDSTSNEPVVPVAPVQRGRPPVPFNKEVGDDLCAWIQSGNSLNKWLKINHVDSRTVYKWMREDVGFAQSYAHAHSDRADTLVEDMLDISEKAEQATDMVQLLAHKLQIETRRWIAERMRPEKYGQKVQVEQKGQVVFQLGIPTRQQRREIDVTPSIPDLSEAKK